MDAVKLDIGEIAELDGTIGIAGAIRAAASPGDGVFEQVIDIAVLIYDSFVKR